MSSNEPTVKKRKSINTTLDEELYNGIQLLSVILTQEANKAPSKEKRVKVKINDLIEEGMRYILEEKYPDKIKKLTQ